MVRVRYAPSPTGYMHIGNLRTALYGFLFARHSNGKFILRIEDTDQERYVPDALQVIYDTLAQTGITYDEGPDKDGGKGPYIQSQRKDIYMRYALQLVEQGDAYYCFCSPQELEARRMECEAQGRVFKYDKHCAHIPLCEAKKRAASGEPFVIRQNVPTTGTVSFRDLVYGDITVDCDTLDDMILIKADGLPTYNFANVIDDHLMEISHVLRGSEYLSSSPKYTLLYKAFGWEEPIYVHLPLIMKDAHNKLSKRNGDASYQDLYNKGFLPQAITNYIALLGWNPGNDQELMSMDELVKLFDLSHCSKSGAKFDYKKGIWFNHEYIMMKPDAEIACLFRPVLESNGIDASNYSDEFLTKVISLVKGRVNFVKELWDQTRFFFVAPTEYAAKDVKKRWSEDTPRIMAELMDVLRGIGDFSSKPSEDIVIGWITERGYHMGNVMNAFRLSVVGECKGPHMFDITELIGKEETLVRIQRAVDALK